MAKDQSVTATNRPMRDHKELLVTVGQGECDFQGNDDKIIQAAIDYVNRLGGGCVQVGEGFYTLKNTIYLRSNITLRGMGEKTVLKKCGSVVTPLTHDADFIEYGVKVEDVKGFEPGGAIALKSTKRKGGGMNVMLGTVVAIEGNTIFFEKQAGLDFWLVGDATASTIFPVITIDGIEDVVLEDIVLDGNRDENQYIKNNGDYVGGVFMQQSNRCTFKNVVSRDNLGDGFSWQTCDDVVMDGCKSINNLELGFHPGSGSQRPVIRNSEASGNNIGIYFCWSLCDGVVENCVASDNEKHGVSIGHRDTDNVFRNITIERNGEAGIFFRADYGGLRTGDRNLIEGCLVRDNGGADNGVGIDITGETRDITIRGTRIENSSDRSGQVGIRFGEKTGKMVLESNSFVNCDVEVEDLRESKF